MEIGFIGLGKMGKNMVKRLLSCGHKIVCTARTESARKEVESAGAIWAEDYSAFSKLLSPPRCVWIMVPAGDITQNVIKSLMETLTRGDVIIDGGNSDYRDTIQRASMIEAAGLEFIDVGTSGGIWGIKNGYCLMIGGKNNVVQKFTPIFSSLAATDGWLHVGPIGSGHFVKMVHNAIEYGMMQAYAEGFELLEKSGFSLDLRAIAHLWNNGSVVRSWLLELSEQIFAKDPHLKELEGIVQDSGECRWAVETAIKNSIAVPVMAMSLFKRFETRDKEAFAGKFLAALRQAFGGHEVKKKEAL